jgi:hypothetical protein
MANQTDLANFALSLIGHAKIPDINAQNNAVAETVRELFQPTMDSALRAAHWNCATARQPLASVDGATGKELQNAYQLPTDPLCLKARRIAGAATFADSDRYHPAKIVFRIEGKTLYTGAATPVLIYTARIDVPLYDSNLYVAAGTLLASFLAIAIRKDYKQQEALFKAWEGLRDEAEGVDDTEGGKDEYVGTEFLHHR